MGEARLPASLLGFENVLMTKRIADLTGAQRERRRAQHHSWRIANKAKIQDYTKRHRERYKDKIKTKNRREKLRAYGMTPEEYAKRLADQNYCCAVCKQGAWDCRDGVLVVDHNHKTGRIRGLLCHRCNSGLGMFDDDPNNLDCGARYLRSDR